MPKEAGEAQKELGIEKEATYIISVINPQKTSNILGSSRWWLSKHRSTSHVS
jgi:hypothetical protein